MVITDSPLMMIKMMIVGKRSTTLHLCDNSFWIRSPDAACKWKDKNEMASMALRENFFITTLKTQLCPMCCFNDHGDNLLGQAIMVTMVIMMTIEIFSQGRAIWGYGDHGNPDNDNDDDEWLLIISLSQGKQHDEPTEPQGAERPPGEIHRQHWDASWESTPHYHQVVTVIITTVIIK